MEYIKIRFGDDFSKLAASSDKCFSDKCFEDMFRTVNPVFSISEQNWKPQMDIYETSKEIIILATIAGVKKEELTIEINNKAVKISGIRFGTPRVNNVKYRLAEIRYGKFERILYLPLPVNMEKVKASYEDGFLEIHLAKLYLDQTYQIPISE